MRALNKHFKIISIAMICIAAVSCAKKKDNAFEESKNIETPDQNKTGDTISTYSGTFHLKATLNEKNSDCSLEATTEEDQVKKQKDFFDKIKTIKDTLNCEQANEAFQCQSISHSELLFKGNLKKENFELKLDDQKLTYVKDIDFGKHAIITTILKGKFYSADLAKDGTMVNVNQVMQKNIIRSGKKCKLAWDFDLYRDKNDVTSKKPPVIKSIEFKPDAQKIKVEIKVTDEDSTDNNVEVFAIHFEKDKAPKQENVDWSKAVRVTKGEYSIANPEEGKTYVIFVKAVDEGDNQAISFKEYLFKKTVVAVNGATGTGEENTTGSGKKETANTYTEAVAPRSAGTADEVMNVEDEDLDEIQEFVKDLCEVNQDIVNKKNNFKKLCHFSFTAENPKFKDGADMVSIETLQLSQFHIHTLPDSIGSMTKVTELYIEKCDLEELPATIGNLKNLTDLYLTSNKIKKVPDEIKNLKSLKEFDLEDNKIQVLPEAVGELKNLTYLGLSSNPITSKEKKRLQRLFGDKVKF